MAEKVLSAREMPIKLRRAFTALRSGRPQPVMLELPNDVCEAEYDRTLDYTPVEPMRPGPDSGAVREAAQRLIAAKEPLIWAGHGVLYAEASAELVAVAERLGAPVMTTLQGKSAFPESHPLSAGVGANASTAMAAHYLAASDVVLALGSSLSVASFTPTLPHGKTILHNTVDPADVNKEYPADVAIIADAKLFLADLAEELDRLLDGPRAEHRARTEATVARLRADSAPPSRNSRTGSGSASRRTSATL